MQLDKHNINPIKNWGKTQVFWKVMNICSTSGSGQACYKPGDKS
jgi:hypothetical protein